MQSVPAIDVASTGIVSAEELVYAYARVATNQGANIVTFAQVTSLEPSGETIRVGLRIGDEQDAQNETIEARCVINAAGLYADEEAVGVGDTAVERYTLAGRGLEGGGAVLCL